MRILILSTFFCGVLPAQVGGPLIGYVPDAAAIRPMYGLPPAGSIGAAIDTGRDFARIAISPTQTFALVTTADTGAVMIFKPASGLAPIAGAASNPDILALSPSGASAALWFPMLNQIEVVTGLPNTPSIATIDASFLNASPLALAVTDDGQWTAGIWSTGVYAFGPSGAVLLPTDPGVVALAFSHNTHNLALATSTRATSISNLGASMTTSVLYDYSAQPLSPRAIAISFDNSLAVVADSTGNLLNISIAASTANLVDCHCSPQGLYGLGAALFRLNEPTAAGRSATATELKIFDASAGAVWIVPPALSLTGGRK
jgi:DNA-binding beta-propeller fold protein YncE